MRYVGLLTLLAPLVTACADGTTSSTIPVRDSAGIRIVEYAVPTPTQILELAPEPLFRHGHRPGDYEFARIGNGVLLPQGGAAIADIGANPLVGQELALFGDNGALRKVIARGGRGPADVRQLRGLFVIAPDTLLVDDIGNRKLMWFSDTTFVRTLSVQGNEALGRLRLQGIDETGQMLMTTGSFNSTFSEPWLQGWMVRVDLATLTPDTLASYDMASNFPRDQPRNVFTPYGDASTSGPMFVHARSDVPQLVWRGSDGVVTQIVRWSQEPRYATADDEAAYRESLAEDLARVNPTMGEADLRAFIERQLANTDFSLDTPMPLFRQLLGDGEGGVWMSEFQPIQGFVFPPRYTVVGADGAWLGTVEMPERFRLLDVRGNRVLGVLVDELGVESVAVFELRMRPVE